ncbi:hypothetical protein M8J77_021704 [Diaphorina citri]|nr:hypothetical protein M8J77_021704 [Diaphorina citri]
MNITSVRIKNETVICHHCRDLLPYKIKDLVSHGELCSGVPRPDGSFRFVCFTCNYHTYKSGHMRQHINGHVGIKPYKCLHCSYKSTQSSCLGRHMRIHTGEKPYACSLCDLKFSQNSQLKYHLTTRHDLPDMSTCLSIECGAKK